MAGAIIKGVLKSKIKPKPKPQYPKKVEGRVKRKAVRAPKELRGDTFLGRRRVLGGVKAPPKTSAKSFARCAVSGSALTYMLTDTLKNKKIKKEAKAEKLKKSLERHKKKTQEKRKKHGKHHYG